MRRCCTLLETIASRHYFSAQSLQLLPKQLNHLERLSISRHACYVRQILLRQSDGRPDDAGCTRLLARSLPRLEGLQWLVLGKEGLPLVRPWDRVAFFDIALEAMSLCDFVNLTRLDLRFNHMFEFRLFVKKVSSPSYNAWWKRIGASLQHLGVSIDDDGERADLENSSSTREFWAPFGTLDTLEIDLVPSRPVPGISEIQTFGSLRTLAICGAVISATELCGMLAKTRRIHTLLLEDILLCDGFWEQVFVQAAACDNLAKLLIEDLKYAHGSEGMPFSAIQAVPRAVLYSRRWADRHALRDLFLSVVSKEPGARSECAKDMDMERRQWASVYCSLADYRESDDCVERRSQDAERLRKASLVEFDWPMRNSSPYRSLWWVWKLGYI